MKLLSRFKNKLLKLFESRKKKEIQTINIRLNLLERRQHNCSHEIDYINCSHEIDYIKKGYFSVFNRVCTLEKQIEKITKVKSRTDYCVRRVKKMIIEFKHIKKTSLDYNGLEEEIYSVCEEVRQMKKENKLSDLETNLKNQLQVFNTFDQKVTILSNKLASFQRQLIEKRYLIQ